ncbi:hypothetical protein NXV34_20630 [Bacteroides fragilis]|nr:hypothetical protein NXV34_20630 [Bacteroides fragilis]
MNTEVRNIADDTRNLIANSYLELMQISENTGAIVKPIQQMQKDIAEVKKNTAGLAPLKEEGRNFPALLRFL